LPSREECVFDTEQSPNAAITKDAPIKPSWEEFAFDTGQSSKSASMKDAPTTPNAAESVSHTERNKPATTRVVAAPNGHEREECAGPTAQVPCSNLARVNYALMRMDVTIKLSERECAEDTGNKSLLNSAVMKLVRTMPLREDSVEGMQRRRCSRRIALMRDAPIRLSREEYVQRTESVVVMTDVTIMLSRTVFAKGMVQWGKVVKIALLVIVRIWSTLTYCVITYYVNGMDRHLVTYATMRGVPIREDFAEHIMKRKETKNNKEHLTESEMILCEGGDIITTLIQSSTYGVVKKEVDIH